MRYKNNLTCAFTILFSIRLLKLYSPSILLVATTPYEVDIAKHVYNIAATFQVTVVGVDGGNNNASVECSVESQYAVTDAFVITMKQTTATGEDLTRSRCIHCSGSI